MRYLHTMVRVTDLDASLHFYGTLFGLKEIRRSEEEVAVLPWFSSPQTRISQMQRKNGAPCLELTYNWDSEEYTGGRSFGHLAYEVDDIYATCRHLNMDNDITINRPPRDGRMAFVRSPDGISIEILQKNGSLAGGRAVAFDGQYRRLVS